MPYVMKILCFSNGTTSKYDNQYVTEYNPFKKDIHGFQDVVFKTSYNICDAKQFENLHKMMILYKLFKNTRIDGKPNRPITAFHVIMGQYDTLL